MTDEVLMLKTLRLAARARGLTSPNPMVGALLIKHGKLISEGYHKRAGTPHAESIAIDKAGSRAAGATLYVSLEPCCHKDKRTPPCAQKIIAAGIRKVVIAMKDPNPKVSGKGIEELEKAGIEVVSGLLEDSARKLNEYYIKHILTGMPFVILKTAMTLDGKVATPEGESKWITGEKARRMVHRLRGGVDAVLSAIGTVKADDPLFTCRLSRGRNPLRVVIDPAIETPLNSCVLSTPPETILVTKKPRLRSGNSELRKADLEAKGIHFIEYEGERVDFRWLMQELGRKGVMSVLIEGGPSLNSSCLEGGIVDKVMFFIAPKIIGGRESMPAVGGTAFRRLPEAHMVRDVKVSRVGDDILVEGYLKND